MKKISTIIAFIALGSVSLMAQTLIGYYSFNTDEKDNSSNGNNLSVTGTPGYSAGKYGNCADFKGKNTVINSDTYFQLPQSKYSPATSHTFCIWAYTPAVSYESNTSTQAFVFQQLDVNGTGRNLFAINTGNNNFTNALSGEIQNVESTHFSTGEWHHYAVVMDQPNKTVKLYVDGTLDITYTKTNDFEACDGELNIGTNKGFRNGWQGKFDELYLFSGLLTEEQIGQVMNNTYISTDVDDVNVTNIKWRYNAIAENIRVLSNAGVSKLAVYDLSGKLMVENRNSDQISTQKLVKGIYICKVETSDNKYETFKIVKN